MCLQFYQIRIRMKAKTQQLSMHLPFFQIMYKTTDNTSHQVRNNEHMGATQSLSFANIPGRNHEVTVTSDQPRFPAPEDAQHQSQAPTIFSAPLNSSNLLSSGQPPEQDQQQPPHDGASNKENNTTQDHTTQDHTSGQTYSHGIGIVTSNPSSQQQYSQSNSVQPLVYSQTSSNVQYTQQSQATNAYQQSSGSSLVHVDASQVSTTQQPTYVLLQAPGDSESGGQPQVFLAMQTTNISTDAQGSTPYITLQPVSVDGGELTSGTLVQEGVNLQQAVMTNSNSSDVKGDSSENNPQQQQQQVVLSIPSQQSILSATNGNSGQLVTYLQPLGNIGVPVSNMDQGQVLMAASDLQGNVTLHNMANINGGKRNVLTTNRQATQVNLSTPRRRLSTDPRSCDQCGRTFKYPSDLKKHLQIHTDIKKFQCEDCNRSFRRLHQLNVHRRIHTGEKPYVCNRCNAQFRHDSTLTMHIRTRHDHLKPFTCDGCSKKFGRMSHLRKHQHNVCGRTSIRTSIAQCKYCDAIFSKKSDLKSHFPVCEKKPERVEKDLNAQQVYQCETCGKVFSRVYDFKRHQLSHSDEKPYGCPQCGKTFKERSSLNKHVKRMHCSEGDGTIPIDDDGIIADDDDEDEDELSVDENELASQANITVPKAAVFTQSGIMTNAVSQVVTANGQTIPASEILNFPEVAEALGINSGSHARVLNTDGHSTMIAITQPGNLETSEVSMDMEQNMMQDGTIIVTDNSTTNTEPFITPNEQLNQITPVDESEPIETVDGIPVIYNPENVDSSAASSIYTTSLASSMVFKRDSVKDYAIKHEEEVADHVKAEQAAAHDLQPVEDPNMLVEE
ncbi:uncharacterized protein [Clytia hemisphaerica]|uniref:C2H2-type domain-containing protein n=1 Tax=Clytia hemisphaerica TaxID=252671 RepID=A0A7M5UUL9_9CNID